MVDDKKPYSQALQIAENYKHVAETISVTLPKRKENPMPPEQLARLQTLEKANTKYCNALGFFSEMDRQRYTVSFVQAKDKIEKSLKRKRNHFSNQYPELTFDEMTELLVEVYAQPAIVRVTTIVSLTRRFAMSAEDKEELRKLRLLRYCALKPLFPTSA